MGVAGAALATAAAEVGSGVLYLVLLLKKKMVEWRRLITPPALADLIPLIRGGAAMLLRQAALNVAFVSATRRTQASDAACKMWWTSRLRCCYAQCAASQMQI